MQTMLILLAVVTAILMVAWSMARLLRQYPAAQDLLWRTTLVAVAITPVALLSRAILTDHQWSLPILPAISTDAVVREVGLEPGSADRGRAVSQMNLRMRPKTRPAEPISADPPDLELGQDDVIPMVAAPNAVASAAGSASMTSGTSTHATVRGPLRDWGILVTAAIVSVWAGGVGLHLIRIIRAAWNANRLLRQSATVIDATALELNCWCARRVGMSVATRLATHHNVTGPVVMGLATPTVVVPPALLLPSARHDLRATLLHENGHLRRHDLPFDLLLRLVVAVLWFHPFVWVMARELRRLREELCDNHVLREERPVAYAEMLLRLALDQRLTESQLIGLGMFTRPHRLESRVDAILSSQRSLATSTTRQTRGLLIVAAGACLIGGLFLRFDHAQLAADDDTHARGTSVAQKEQSTADKPLNANEQADNPALESKPAVITFKIVDSAGKPIEGVDVTPWALSISGGAFFTDHKWETTKSDADGRVVIPLTVGISQTVTAVLKHPGTAGIESIGFKAEHPNFPIWSSYLRLVGDATTLALSDPVTIHVRAQREGETVAATRLYPDVTNTHSRDWSEADGVLTYRNLDLTQSRWLRVTQIPEQGDAWFSEVVDLQHLGGESISLSVTLKPGTRVTGRLSDNVPRPVRNGRLIGVVVSPRTTDYHQSMWNATTKIAEDGSFMLETMPSDETLQLIAICDGWVSRSPLKAETQAYLNEHGFPKDGAVDPTSGMVFPQLVWLSGPSVDTSIPMTQTGSCEVTAVDDKTGQPLAGIEISFSPNQLIHQSGTTFLGSGYDELAAARAQLADGKVDLKAYQIRSDRLYQAKTNEQGVAVISGLPGLPEGSDSPRQMMYFAHSDTLIGFPEEPLQIELPFYAQPLLAAVTAGKTERMTIRMVPIADISDEAVPQDEDFAAGAFLPAMSSGTAFGRVDDERGKPIEGVTVKIELMEMAIEIEGLPPEAKSEFDRLNSIAVQTDHEGRFVFPLQECCGEGGDVSVPLRFTKAGFADHVQMVRSTKDRMLVRMHAGTSLTGTVHLVDGNPAANAVIRAYHTLRFPGKSSEDVLVWHETTSDDQGQYKLLVQPDEYQIMARHPNGETAWLPKQPPRDESDNGSSRPRNLSDRTKVNIRRHEAKQLDIQLQPAVEFRAKAVNSLTGEPLAGIWFQQEHYPWIDSRTDDAGNVAIQSLPAESINFTFTADSHRRAWSDGASAAWKERHLKDPSTTPGMVPINEGITFDLKPGMPPVVVTFEPAIKITGRVLDPAGQPIAGIDVMPVHRTDSPSKATPQRAWARTDANGRFELNASAPEDGRIVLLGSDQRPIDRSSNAGRPNSTPADSGRRTWANGFSQPIQVLPGDNIKDVELRLSRPGTVQGRLVTQNGDPLTAVPILVSPFDYSEEPRYRPSTTTDRNGRFTLTLVRPGRHKLYARIDTDPPGIETALPEVEVQSDQTVDVQSVIIPMIKELNK